MRKGNKLGREHFSEKPESAGCLPIGTVLAGGSAAWAYYSVKADILSVISIFLITGFACYGLYLLYAHKDCIRNFCLFDYIGLGLGAFFNVLLYFDDPRLALWPWVLITSKYGYAVTRDELFFLHSMAYGLGGCFLFHYGFTVALSQILGKYRKRERPVKVPQYDPYSQGEAPLHEDYHVNPDVYVQQTRRTIISATRRASPDPGRQVGSGREQLALDQSNMPQEYSTKAGKELYKLSRVKNNPSSTDEATELLRFCVGSLGTHRGIIFVSQAARDRKLPSKMRKMYVHADQIAARMASHH